MTDYELVNGSIYETERLGDKIVKVEKGRVSILIEESRLFKQLVLGRLFFCDQCGYFNESAQAVQEHSEQEHDCRYETYETTDIYGAKRLRVRTVKCHPRITIRPSKNSKPWEGL